MKLIVHKWAHVLLVSAHVLLASSLIADAFLRKLLASTLASDLTLSHSRHQNTQTTTTTPLPPIELQFEIQSAQDSQQQQREELELESNGMYKMANGQLVNGSLILEDLVNQIGRNFLQKKRGIVEFPQQQQQQAQQTFADFQEDHLIYANKTSADDQLPPARMASMIVEPTHGDRTATGPSYKPSVNDSLVEQLQHEADLEDRHIQYDSAPSVFIDQNSTHVVANLSSPSQSLNRTSNLFTLEPIRVQSERITFATTNDTNGQAPISGLQYHQARSLSSSSAPTQSRHHSKPPYDRHNHFYHSRPEVLVDQSNNLTARQAMPMEAKTTGSELVNSISRISSHLMGEATDHNNQMTTTTTTTSTTSTTTPAPPTHEQAQQLLEEQRKRQEELERVASKLAPANELVDLAPIPMSVSMTSGGHYAPSDSTNHYLYAPAAVDRNLEWTPAENDNTSGQSRYQNDRYANSHFDTSYTTSRHSPPPPPARPPTQHFRPALTPQANVLRNGDTEPPEVDEMRASQLHSSQHVGPNLLQLHKKTLDALSSQIQHSDSQLSASQTPTTTTSMPSAPAVAHAHQHKERSPNSLELNRAGGVSSSSYAASLINVTAPMNLPLSATEAMEASLGTDQAARQLLHQVGGGSVLLNDGTMSTASDEPPPPPPVATPPSTANRSQQRPPGGYYANGANAGAIYSRPANQFSPRPPAFAASSTAHAHYMHDADGLTLSAAERERLRLGDTTISGSGLASIGHTPSTAAAAAHASGFRSPTLRPTGPPSLSGGSQDGGVWAAHTTSSSYLLNANSGRYSGPASSSSSMQTTLAPSTMDSNSTSSSTSTTGGRQSSTIAPSLLYKNSTSGGGSGSPSTTNGFITSSVANASTQATSTSSSEGLFGTGSTPPQLSQQVSPTGSGGSLPVANNNNNLNKRVFNLTRVEHISAECSNDLIRTVIIFNGTFKGIIYSSGYVRDSQCLYINGTGKTRYDFSIKLNQCGTLGRQELHPSTGGPNEVRRRDQVMWNTLSIQYNPVIEQEWDEHFRVSCEYGSDFWKTISFSPFNVETNTGSPVVFTVDPPQCQMEILKGHGMVGPRQEAISGPVTVGDPLTLLIHMKSEKAGYDILVKNCVAHNGGQQKMQLIDSNGCVVNERFISPFRGTYNDNDLKHVTLYSYLKAFRFTGSPVLYLECEVHMCQSACPPQMCYWRRLSKRSASNETAARLWPEDFELEGHEESYQHEDDDESHTKVRFDLTTSTTTQPTTTTTAATRRRAGRKLREDQQEVAARVGAKKKEENPSDRVSLFQALEVRQEREPADFLAAPQAISNWIQDEQSTASQQSLMCYKRLEVFAFLFTTVSMLLAALSVTIGCCLRASTLKRQAERTISIGKSHNHQLVGALSLSSANLGYTQFANSRSLSYLSPSPSESSSSSSSALSQNSTPPAILPQTKLFTCSSSSADRKSGQQTVSQKQQAHIYKRVQ